MPESSNVPKRPVASDQQSGEGPEFVGVNWQVYVDRVIASMQCHANDVLHDLRREIDHRFEKQDEALTRMYNEKVEREHVTAQVATEVRIVIASHINTMKETVDARISSTEAALRQSQESAKEAVTKAEHANEVRFHSVNEFRKTLSDQTAFFITRQSFEESQKSQQDYRDNLNERLAQINARLNKREGQDSGGQDTKSEARANIGVLFAGAALVATLATMAVNFFNRSAAPTPIPASIPPGYTLVPQQQAK